MKKGCFWDRLCLVAFGCAATRPSLQPQPQSQPGPESIPAQVMPYGELLIILIVVLVAVSLIIPLFKGNKPKTRRARPERKKRKR
ncbi:MAG: hypothetical protein ISS45_08120 [Candidatus Omnitrophica bacterium]|nr:hypothetical protein [Candidatus Omnitrophota bacterium]